MTVIGQVPHEAQSAILPVSFVGLIQVNFRDSHFFRDTLHSLAVSVLACLLSAGTVYLLYLVRVVVVALRVRKIRPDGGCVLLFGKRLVAGAPDPDFQTRILAAQTLLASDAVCRAILLGGGSPGQSEAEAAQRMLLRGQPSLGDRLSLEAHSENTLENLRNARELMASLGVHRAVLVSNRYHLARCAQFATQLGLEFQLYPAEERFVWNVGSGAALLREAFCLCWLEVGTKWARVIGHRRMLARVS